MLKLNESTKIELWAATGCITAALLFSITEMTINAQYMGQTWISLLFNYMVTCICYLLLVLYVDQEFKKSDKEVSIAVIFVYILINICFVIEIINAYFTALLAIKILIIYFRAKKENPKNQIYAEATLLFACSIFIHACLVLSNSINISKAFFTFIAPISIFLYLYLMYAALPHLITKSRHFLRYLGSSLLFTAVSFIPLGILLAFYFSNNNNQNIPEVLLAFNAPVQLIVHILAWNIFKFRNRRKAEEIQTLKTELGKSDANLNFLKSQINPHFLFNALNTLYGTALQEQAERTGEGIQKLGDMMRFMLQENIEDKIPLSRDVDYLNNYIDLQKLRTSTSSQVAIEIQIEEQLNNLQITPMLLIPFVENAFKHGISLLYPSHIKITLQINNSTLYFDVHNSIHLKQDNDPEKLQSGIGLQNVKQRLALIYPGRHELIIRENAKEFFVHLTLQLTENH
ncbi:sensor histidine kinase [Pedobacter psychroterrae]|uniref:Sensor histidine kinase n=1 Tax=Pedobacter psychroterrae TaxID=2530453 RepID=A0A4R0NRA2_9SPHI|nr:histidine kinase [Pedobacter psychroterrae]TCD03631.1 sensor histidine kinase [Pedobacter psychroterrae]